MSKNEIQKISREKRVKLYTISDKDLGHKFSLSLSLMLDSHPVVPKQVLIVKKSSSSKNSHALIISVGASQIKFKYHKLSALFYITIWPARWEKITFRKNGNIVDLFVNCVKIDSRLLLTDRHRELPNRWMFRESQVGFVSIL